MSRVPGLLRREIVIVLQFVNNEIEHGLGKAYSNGSPWATCSFQGIKPDSWSWRCFPSPPPLLFAASVQCGRSLCGVGGSRLPRIPVVWQARGMHGTLGACAVEAMHLPWCSIWPRWHAAPSHSEVEQP